MNFRKASEIARMNPGATITRDELGGFLVRKPDGGLLGADLNVAVMDSPRFDGAERDALHQKCMRLQEEIREAKQLLHASESRENLLHAKLLSLREDCQKLRVSASKANSEAHELRQKLIELQSEHVALKAKAGRVSDAEWARIAELERAQREEEFANRRAERRSISCPCSGEVENCARCYGAGEYVVDGFGNRV